jgi:hypothetical protein
MPAFLILYVIAASAVVLFAGALLLRKRSVSEMQILHPLKDAVVQMFSNEEL